MNSIFNNYTTNTCEDVISNIFTDNTSTNTSNDDFLYNKGKY